MPTGRLNRTVLWMALAVLAVGAVLVATDRLAGPQRYMALAEKAMASGDYGLASRWILRAYERATSVQLRRDLLWQLSKAYLRSGLWPQTLGCWQRIIEEDPCDIKAQLALLEADYIQADAWTRLGGPQTGLWRSVQERADALLGIVAYFGLADLPIAQWRLDELQAIAVQKAGPIGPYLHLVRGRALYQQACSGIAGIPDQSLEMAQVDLQAAVKADPCLVDAYWYLYKIQLELAKAMEKAGDIDRALKARQAAIDLLRQVAQTSDQPMLYVYLSDAQLEAVMAGRDYKSIAAGLAGLDGQYTRLEQTFPNSAQAMASLARYYLLQAYYQGPGTRTMYLDKAIQAGQKAMALDPNNPNYTLAVAQLYYRRYVLTGTDQDAGQAMSLAKKATTMAESFAHAGPGGAMGRAILLDIYNVMAQWEAWQLLQDTTASLGEQELSGLRQAVKRIGQVVPRSGHLLDRKWKALVDLLSGRTEQAVKELYGLYQHDKTTRPDGIADPLICYALGKVFANGPEVGQAAQFVADALRVGMGLEQPSVILEYLDLLGRIGMWAYVISPANPYNLDTYEAMFGRSDESVGLRIRALAGTNQLAQGLAEINSIAKPTGPILVAWVELLEAQIKQIRAGHAVEQLKAGGLVDPQSEPAAGEDPTLIGLRRQQAELVCRLLETRPELVNEQMVISAAHALADVGRLGQARQALGQFIHTRPRYGRPPVGAIFTSRLFEEPDPRVVAPLRRDEILEQTIQGLDDPVYRALELGLFYRQTARLEQAHQQLMAALELAKEIDWSARLPVVRQLYANPTGITAELASELAIRQGDWDLANKIAGIAHAKDLDGCSGLYYRARLLHAQGQQKQALQLLDHAIKQRPVFSAGYMLRASIYTQLGQDKEALADMEEAARLCPDSPQVAKGLAVTLYWAANRQGLRGQLAGQIRSALEKALRLDPSDPRLLGIYAEQIKDAEPLKALQVYQVLLRYEPTVQNTLALADLASTVVSRQGPGLPRKGLLEVARLALEHAYALEPNNPQVIQQYASYYQQVGQSDKAQRMLERLRGTSMAWKDLVAQGRLKQARDLLEKAIQDDPNNLDTLSGLVQIAQVTGDRQALVEYSDRLVQIRQDPHYRVEQVMIFIRAGLIEHARQRLYQLRALYPEQEDIGLLEAWLLVRSGQLSQARARIDQVVRSYPDNRLAWLMKGHIAMLACRFDQAIEAFGKAVSDEQEPGRRLMLADAYRLAGKTKQAVDFLEGLLDQPGAAWQALRRLQWIYRQDPNSQQVELAYQKLADAFHDQPRWINRLAGYALSKRQYTKACQLFARAMDLIKKSGSPSAKLANPDYIDACEGYLQACIDGQDRQALQSALAQIIADANGLLPATLLCLTAKARHILSDKAGALEDAHKAIIAACDDIQQLGTVLQQLQTFLDETAIEGQIEAMGPDRPAYWAARAQMALTDSRYEEALNAMDRCIAISGRAATDLRQYKGQVLVLAYERTADNRFLQQAAAVYEELASDMPTDSGVLNNLAYVLAQSPGQAQRALQLAQKALELAPESPAVMDTYGYALYRNGRLQEALDWLLAADTQFQVNCMESPADVYEHIGMVYQALGHKGKALEAYRQALAAADNAAVKARIQAAIQGLGP